MKAWRLSQGVQIHSKRHETAMSEDNALALLQRDDPDQIIEPVGYDFGFSRRSFMQVLGAGLLISAASESVLAQERPGGGRRGGGGGRGGGGFAGQEPTNLHARLHLGAGGVLTGLTGQGA